MIKFFADRIAKALSYVLIAAFAMMLGLTLWQVFARYVLGEPDTFTDELLRITLMWFGMLAGSYCVWSKAHIGFDLISNRISGLAARAMRWLALLLALFVTVTGLIAGGLRLVLLAADLDQRTPVMGLAMAQVYWVLPISGVLILVFLIAHGFDRGSDQQEDAM